MPNVPVILTEVKAIPAQIGQDRPFDRAPEMTIPTEAWLSLLLVRLGPVISELLAWVNSPSED